MKHIFFFLSLTVVLTVGGVDSVSAVDPWQALRKGDYKSAERIWLPKAEKGEIQAQIFLGHMESMRERNQKAAEWYARAASKGNAEAQVLLANLFLEGRGVPQDPVLAYVWYELAATRGHQNAGKARDAVARMLPASDLDRADRLAENWIESGPPRELVTSP